MGSGGAKVILDLCGGSGAWSKPYQDAGYEVKVVDLPQDVRLRRFQDHQIHGILCAPPCTVFSYARNRYPPTEEEFKEALSVVDACLRMVQIYKPQWWALENPRNKLRRFLGPATMTFYQYEFGDAAAKPTCLWGDFNIPRKNPGPKLKPSTFKTSVPNASPQDAITPPKFAQAFFEANP